MRSTLLIHTWSNSVAKQSLPPRGTCLDHIWLKSTVWQDLQWGAYVRTTFGQSLQWDKVLQQGAHFRPHLVKVRCVTKSSNEGHNLGHIWLKSAVWQSPPMRGTIWATFGQSPLRDKVLQRGAQFGLHSVKVRCVTKPSNEGHSLDHIWSKSAMRQSPPMRGTIFCYIWPLSAAWQLGLMTNHGYHSLGTFDQSPLCDMSSDKLNVFSFLC